MQAQSRTEHIQNFLIGPDSIAKLDAHLDKYADLYEAKYRDKVAAGLGMEVGANDRDFEEEESDEEKLTRLDGLYLIIKIAEQAKLTYWNTRYTYLRAIAYDLLELWELALEECELAIQLCPSDEHLTKAQCLFFMGETLRNYDLEEYSGKNALQWYRDAETALGSPGSTLLYGELQKAIGLYYTEEDPEDSYGVSDKLSEEAFRKSWDHFNKLGDKSRAAATYIQLSQLYAGSDKTYSDEKINGVKEELYKILRDDQLDLDEEQYATCEASLALCYQGLVTGNQAENRKAARKHYERASEIYRKIDDRYGEIAVRVNLNSLALEEEDYALAASLMEPIMPQLADIGDSYLVQKATKAIGNSLAHLEASEEDYKKGCDYLRQVIVMAKETNHDHMVDATLDLISVQFATLYENNQINLDEIEHLIEQLPQIDDILDRPSMWSQIWQAKIKLEQARENWKQAVTLGQQAAKEFNLIFDPTKSLDTRRWFVHDYSEIVDSSVANLAIDGRADEAISVWRREHGKLFSRRNREVAHIDKHEAELYCLYAEIESSGLVILNDPYETKPYLLSGIDKPCWDNWLHTPKHGIIAMRNGITDGARFRKYSRQLNAMIDELSEAFAKIGQILVDQDCKKLYIELSSNWHHVPFAALKLPDGRTWGDAFELSFNGKPQDPVQPKLGSCISFCAENLEDAEEEYEELEERFTIKKKLRTLQEVQDALASGEAADIWHFTSHGVHDFKHIDSGGIICSDNDLLTAAWVYENAKLTGNPIVMIAACESGIADYANLPSEQFGLPAAFIEAGAALVVATLWPVDNTATRLFVTFFYEALKEADSPAQAMQKAQARLRNIRYEDEIPRKIRALQQIRISGLVLP